MKIAGEIDARDGQWDNPFLRERPRIMSNVLSDDTVSSDEILTGSFIYDDAEQPSEYVRLTDIAQGRVAEPLTRYQESLRRAETPLPFDPITSERLENEFLEQVSDVEDHLIYNDRYEESLYLAVEAYEQALENFNNALETFQEHSSELSPPITQEEMQRLYAEQQEQFDHILDLLFEDVYDIDRLGQELITSRQNALMFEASEIFYAQQREGVQALAGGPSGTERRRILGEILADRYAGGAQQQDVVDARTNALYRAHEALNYQIQELVGDLPINGFVMHGLSSSIAQRFAQYEAYEIAREYNRSSMVTASSEIQRFQTEFFDLQLEFQIALRNEDNREALNILERMQGRRNTIEQFVSDNNVDSGLAYGVSLVTQEGIPVGSAHQIQIARISSLGVLYYGFTELQKRETDEDETERLDLTLRHLENQQSEIAETLLARGGNIDAAEFEREVSLVLDNENLIFGRYTAKGGLLERTRRTHFDRDREDLPLVRTLDISLLQRAEVVEQLVSPIRDGRSDHPLASAMARFTRYFLVDRLLTQSRNDEAIDNLMVMTNPDLAIECNMIDIRGLARTEVHLEYLEMLREEYPFLFNSEGELDPVDLSETGIGRRAEWRESTQFLNAHNDFYDNRLPNYTSIGCSVLLGLGFSNPGVIASGAGCGRIVNEANDYVNLQAASSERRTALITGMSNVREHEALLNRRSRIGTKRNDDIFNASLFATMAAGAVLAEGTLLATVFRGPRGNSMVDAVTQEAAVTGSRTVTRSQGQLAAEEAVAEVVAGGGGQGAGSVFPYGYHVAIGSMLVGGSAYAADHVGIFGRSGVVDTPVGQFGSWGFWSGATLLGLKLFSPRSFDYWLRRAPAYIRVPVATGMHVSPYIGWSDYQIFNSDFSLVDYSQRSQFATQNAEFESQFAIDNPWLIGTAALLAGGYYAYHELRGRGGLQVFHRRMMAGSIISTGIDVISDGRADGWGAGLGIPFFLSIVGFQTLALNANGNMIVVLTILGFEGMKQVSVDDPAEGGPHVPGMVGAMVIAMAMMSGMMLIQQGRYYAAMVPGYNRIWGALRALGIRFYIPSMQNLGTGVLLNGRHADELAILSTTNLDITEEMISAARANPLQLIDDIRIPLPSTAAGRSNGNTNGGAILNGSPEEEGGGVLLRALRTARQPQTVTLTPHLVTQDGSRVYQVLPQNRWAVPDEPFEIMITRNGQIRIAENSGFSAGRTTAGRLPSQRELSDVFNIAVNDGNLAMTETVWEANLPVNFRGNPVRVFSGQRSRPFAIPGNGTAGWAYQGGLIVFLGGAVSLLGGSEAQQADPNEHLINTIGDVGWTGFGNTPAQSLLPGGISGPSSRVYGFIVGAAQVSLLNDAHPVYAPNAPGFVTTMRHSLFGGVIPGADGNIAAAFADQNFDSFLVRVNNEGVADAVGGVLGDCWSALWLPFLSNSIFESFGRYWTRGVINEELIPRSIVNTTNIITTLMLLAEQTSEVSDSEYQRQFETSFNVLSQNMPAQVRPDMRDEFSGFYNFDAEIPNAYRDYLNDNNLIPINPELGTHERVRRLSPELIRFVLGTRIEDENGHESFSGFAGEFEQVLERGRQGQLNTDERELLLGFGSFLYILARGQENGRYDDMLEGVREVIDQHPRFFIELVETPLNRFRQQQREGDAELPDYINLQTNSPDYNAFQNYVEWINNGASSIDSYFNEGE